MAGGENSGASQPHKHMQFIPVDDGGPPVDKLARSIKVEDERQSIQVSICYNS